MASKTAAALIAVLDRHTCRNLRVSRAPSGSYNIGEMTIAHTSDDEDPQPSAVACGCKGSTDWILTKRSPDWDPLGWATIAMKRATAVSI
ncbi:hypothetical protein GCM10007880_66410 [Mesorhizobium amorphae]|nr:hypothetical protein GCM10007880_66410 [Mesorhizobium amorphae]